MGNLGEYLSEVGQTSGANVANGMVDYGLWRLKQDYLSPKNQKQRLLDAGVSPAAATEAIAGNPTPGGSIGMATTNQNANVGLQGKQIKQQLRFQEELTQGQLDLMASEAEKNRAEAYRIQELTPEEKKQIMQNVNESISREKLNNEQKRNVVETTNKLLEFKGVEYQTAVASLRYIKAQIRGQIYRNKIEKVKATLAETYHINPDSDWGSQLIQLLLSGDETVLDTVLDSVKSTLSGAFDNDEDAFNWHNVKNDIGYHTSKAADYFGLLDPRKPLVYRVRKFKKNRQQHKASKSFRWDVD